MCRRALARQWSGSSRCRAAGRDGVTALHAAVCMQRLSGCRRRWYRDGQSEHNGSGLDPCSSGRALRRCRCRRSTPHAHHSSAARQLKQRRAPRLHTRLLRPAAVCMHTDNTPKQKKRAPHLHVLLEPVYVAGPIAEDPVGPALAAAGARLQLHVPLVHMDGGVVKLRHGGDLQPVLAVTLSAGTWGVSEEAVVSASQV